MNVCNIIPFYSPLHGGAKRYIDGTACEKGRAQTTLSYETDRTAVENGNPELLYKTVKRPFRRQPAKMPGG
ncbi:hypothetical protein EGM51_07290 [Verrucomicrobia bacterium S94]|nr:hypothetical protein EGM51_07290 [Verrucomicrobia bacterium S94]